MRVPRRRGVTLDLHAVLIGHRQHAGLERANVAKAKIGQRHALAGGAEEGSVLGDAQRAKAKRVSRDDELSMGGEQDDVVGTVKLLGQPAKDPHPVWLRVFGLKLVSQRVHDDFGVGVSLQMIVALGEQLLFQFLIIGELAIEGEGEPLGLAAVVALERLGVITIVAPAGGVSDVADGGRAVHALHDRLEFQAMVEAERLGDRSQLFVGFQKCVAIGTKARHAGGKLPAVLHVQQHSRDQPSDAVDFARNRGQLGNGGTFGVEHSSHAALVVELAHWWGFPSRYSPRAGRGGSGEENALVGRESSSSRPPRTHYYNVVSFYVQPSSYEHVVFSSLRL